jgi:hypothetical protein
MGSPVRYQVRERAKQEKLMGPAAETRVYRLPASAVSLLMLFTVGCSSDDESETPGPTPPTTPPAGEWMLLAQQDWTLAPGDEYPDLCLKQQLTRDIYVSAIRPVHPKGTHHTFVALSDTATGERCTTAVGTGLIYAAGVGSEGLHMPEGVALKLPAGKFLNLSLHLYNATGEELRGSSGLEVIEMDPADVVYESSPLLAGPVGFQIPPGRTTLQHSCMVGQEVTAFALFPHMHQLGTHLKTTVTVAGETKVIHDGDYDFEEQRQFPIGPLKFMPGDTIATECTYENPGTRNVTFGESSDTEMCFSVLFRYPNTGSAFCVGGR